MDSQGADREAIGELRRKRKRNSEREKKRRKECHRIQMRKVKATESLSTDEKPRILSKPHFLSVGLPNGLEGKAHFLPNVFLPEKIELLALLLDNEKNFWKEKKDSRRLTDRSSRRYFIAGRWAAVGHTRPGVDMPHWAKPGGDICNFKDSRLLPLLLEFSEKASGLIKKYRPDVSDFLGHNSFNDVFGMFHLFFGLQGTVRFHRDPNDYISFAFPIRIEKNCGGGLILKDANVCFSNSVRDAVILDTDLLVHGNKEYNGAFESRQVGVFVVQKTYLRLKGIFPQ